MQVGRTPLKPAVKLFLLVAATLGAAVVIFAWGQQMQSACRPMHGTSCVEDLVPNQMAFGLTALGVGFLVIGLAMWLYNVGVNGWLADLQARAGEPAGKRRR